jgi:hypothetical protein
MDLYKNVPNSVRISKLIKAIGYITCLDFRIEEIDGSSKFSQNVLCDSIDFIVDKLIEMVSLNFGENDADFKN